VLGSGGHTAEMLSMLRRMPLDPNTYTFRTYVVTSRDSFSASKAAAFEATLHAQYKDSKQTQNQDYEIITVPRARRVHQSYLTAPFSTIQCFWACLQVLRGRHADQQRSKRNAKSPYPDLILTNGPATAVCVVLGAKLLRFWIALSAILQLKTSQTSKDNSATTSPLRTVFIESWARVTTLSLSGKILLPFVDRFLVQWPNLEGKQAWRGMRKAEYVGTIID
jgi:beta-1,4-N-acetylglucosaminyltransferase